VFALTRKKMGEIYGARKHVSAVALLELNGVDDLVAQVCVCALACMRAWEKRKLTYGKRW